MRNKRKYLILTIVLIGVIYGYKYISYKGINDYYDYVNKDYLDNLVLEDNKVGVSEFTKYQEEVDKEIDDITNNLINNNSNVKSLYNMLLNTNRSNKVIYDYMNLIDSSKSIDDFINNTIIIEDKLNIDIFTKVSIMKDLYNNQKNIVYFEPINFEFSAPAYMYNDSNYDSYVSIFKGYQIKFMKAYGYDTKKAREISNNIFNMEKDIASHSLKYSEINHIEKLYHKIDINDLQKIYTNIDINKYLKIKGVDKEEYYSIVDIENYKSFNSYLTNDNLNTLKEYVKFRILEEYASFIDLKYAKLVRDINNTTLELNKEYDIKEEALDIIESYYNDVIEKEYVLKNSNSEQKEYLNSMIKEIIDYYKKDINDLKWMSKNTKENAIKKLDNLRINIYKEKFDIISDKYNIDSNKSLVENIINMNKINYKYNIDLLNNNKDIELISESTVNAYYNPQDNSINFPVAFNKFLNINNSYYENLGTVGMVIAHEITHAFDNNGSKFDYLGNLNNWWTIEDNKKFNELTKEVEDFYSSYKINGININGHLTVGENIADLGSINCITSIAHNKKASKEDFKKLFTSFAKMWRSKYVDTYQKILLTSDTHSPDKVRVNATLSNNDYFYNTYDIKWLDKMYIKEKVGIW